MHIRRNVSIKGFDHHVKVNVKKIDFTHDGKIRNAVADVKINEKKYHGTVHAIVKNRKVKKVTANGNKKFQKVIKDHKEEIIHRGNKELKKRKINHFHY